MKAITPAKLIPPDQSTAASGTLPTEQTKLSTAISGPTRTFSSVRSQRRRVGDEEDVEEVVAEQADEAGEQEADRDLLPEHRPVAAEVDARRRSRPRPSVSRSRQPVLRRPSLVLVAGLRLLGVLARLLLQPRGDEAAQQHRHQHDQDQIPPTYSASVNCQPISTQSTSPSSQTRLVEANWKASAVTAEAPFWKSDLAIAIAA